MLKMRSKQDINKIIPSSIGYKKSQISIFLLIGIILLVGGVVYFLFSETEVFSSPQAQSQEQISEVLRFCVENELDNAVRVLQFKGGRIGMEPYETQQRVNTFDFDIYSWSSIPTLQDMEEELKSEIEEKSVGCIAQNLRGLDEVYEIEGFSEDLFSVNVDVVKAEVQAEVELPLNIRLRGTNQSWEYSSLQVNLPSALYSNFELAKAIYYEHQSNQVFENLVLEQISMAKDYSDPQASVPTQGVQFSCSTPIWRASEIQNSILNLNEFNFNLLYFNKTEPIENRFLGLPDDVKEYYDTMYSKELTILDPSVDVSSKEVDVVVPKEVRGIGENSQLSTFRTFRVNGETKEFIKPEQLKFSGSIPIPCMSVFSKVYDLDYDIIVEIESYQEGTFEVFRVPIRIQIEKNEPKSTYNANRALLPQDQLTRDSQIMCEEENDKRVDIFIHEVSSLGLSPLFGADVSYSCAGVECENLGPQTTQLSSDEAKVEAQVPFCSNARINVEKDGYLHLDTLEKQEELGFNHCGDSRVRLDEEVPNTLPYLDVCMIRLQEIQINTNGGNDNTAFFDIDRGMTIGNPQGEVVILVENEALDYSSIGNYNYETGEELLLKIPAIENFNANVTLMYYEDDELLSYYMYENQLINSAFVSQVSLVLPVLGSGIEDIEDFERMEESYEEGGFLDVEFGYEFN